MSRRQQLQRLVRLVNYATLELCLRLFPKSSDDLRPTQYDDTTSSARSRNQPAHSRRTRFRAQGPVQSTALPFVISVAKIPDPACARAIMAEAPA
jgi:hypothetical protein